MLAFKMPGEADITSSTSATEAIAAAPAPASEVVAPDTTSAVSPKRAALQEKLRKALPPAQQKVLASRDQAQGNGTNTDAPAGAAADAPAKGTTPTPEVKSPATPPEGERVTFGEEPPPVVKDGAPADEHELTPDQLKLLSEDARKKISEAGKENARIRKRAQEAEAKIAEAEKARDAALAQLHQAQTRGGMKGNTFADFTEAKGVTDWAGAGQAILDQFTQVSIKHAANEEIPDELLRYTLPNGQEIKLDSSSHTSALTWVKDAKAWQDHAEKAGKYKGKAKPVVDKHATLEGYEAARTAILADPHVTARIEELAAKAAFYDVLESRKGSTVIFGKVDAATNASTSQAAEVQTRAPTPTPTPPRDLATSSPRLVPADQAGNANRSLLKEQAMKSGNPDDIKAALLAGRRGAA